MLTALQLVCAARACNRVRTDPGKMSVETVIPGADDWEALQLRQRALPIAKVLPLSADGPHRIGRRRRRRR